MGLVFMALFHVFGFALLLPRHAMLAALLIAAAEIDRRHGIIPNRLVAAGAVLGLAWILAAEAGALGTYLLAAVACAGVLLAIRLGSRLVLGRAGLGMGDVKLAAMTGLFLGWSTLWVFYLAVVLGGVLGLVGLLTGRLERTSRLPMAPFVAVGAGLHLFLVPPSLVLPLLGYVL
jgi:leader peptidase (prepilin peptidase)/N-methyltransferase